MSGKLLRGTITADTVDISDEVSQCLISLARDSVAVPGTFGSDPYDEQGALKKQCTLTYRSGKDGAAGSVSGDVFWDAIIAGENVDITAVFTLGAVSATNPEYQFTVVPLETSRGGTIGEVPQVNVTYGIVGDIVVSATGT